MTPITIPPTLYGVAMNFGRAICANSRNPQVVQMLNNSARSLYSLTQPVVSQVIKNPSTARAVVQIAGGHGVRITLAALLADAIPFLILAAIVLAIVYSAKVEQENNLRRAGKTADLQNLQLGYENFMQNSPLSPVIILKTRNIPPELRHLV